MSTRVEAIPADPAALMRSILKRIATGPELSKDISREEACAGMRLVLDGQVDPVQAGVFLIALRMKRETDDENCGVLEAIREATRYAIAPVDEVMSIGDPYDGYNRTLPASPFLPSVLAACGIAAVSHGVERMGPKYGVTHRRVLGAAGLPVDMEPEEAAARVGDPRVGWAYIDQKAFCPKLYGLAALRTLIVKRPAITTTEVLVAPVRGRVKTHFVTGYVHKPYPRIYALLARHAGFASALIVRGVEGGVIPSLSHTGKVFHYHDRGEETSTEFKPADLGIDQSVRAPRLPGGPAGEDADDGPEIDNDAVAKAAAEAGIAALTGQPGPTRDSLVYGAALCLWHLGRHGSLKSAADAARAALDSGEALRRLRRTP
ncbi:MAG: anthranilate phosphoribosyltransferase [Betaproteobacteria bacterium]|nr:anthranilate phosphoribosyltransferase [Betaproteobacteria bacterium]